MGRLTRDPEVRYTGNENALVVAQYTLAVNRRYKRDGEAAADFIRCIAFGKAAQFAEKYFYQGIRICVSVHLRSGSYTNREGQKIDTTDVIIEEQDFAESRKSSELTSVSNSDTETDADGFMNIPDGLDEELPFH